MESLIGDELEHSETLSAALHVLAGDVCLRVSGSYLPVCTQFSVSDGANGSNNSNDTGQAESMAEPKAEPEIEIEFKSEFKSDPKIEATALSTWLCKDAHFFTLFRPTGAEGTLLFSHTNEVLYNASIEAQLSKDCPADLCFLCQFTTDSLPDGCCAPRLLAFDVITARMDQQPPPGTRGEILRVAQAHLPLPLCVAQWIGPRQYLSREFIAGLPHKIKGVFALGDTPLVAAALECVE
jgi:hypothetical protein